MRSVVIVGGDSPLGREVRDQLTDASIDARVDLLGTGDEVSTILTAVKDEAAVVTPLDAERVKAADLIVCAGDAASTRRSHKLADAAERPLIDLTHTLEDLPGSRLRSSLMPSTGAATVYISAHPGAAAVAFLITQLHQAFPLRHAVVQVFEPASERGEGALTELQQQVTGLLSFRQMEKRIFDAQLAFNLLPRYGEDAPEQLQDIEARLERHLATLMAGHAPMPSLRLVQAPVFHGHSLSLWIEFDSRPSVTAVAALLSAAGVDVRGPEVEPPTNVGVAGQSDVVAGVIEDDRSHPRAMWLWAVVDNYRLAADTVVGVARELL